jgi:Carboxypeptidase regulatory-like domain
MEMPSTAPLTLRALLLALAVCGFASITTAKQVSGASATITGTIVDDSGQPAKDATVFVYSARLKKGYAIVCPTCWIDCGKHTDTDGEGYFTITDLNPALKFRLLVVKDGFTATAKGGVDPAQGRLQPIKLSRRVSSPDESKIVHGLVTDAAGNPVAGALIEPVGAIQSDGMMSFGTIDWIDSLAATNASGKFAIVVTKPVEKIILKISPRTLAPKIVTEPPGPATNAIVLTEGATIIGRLVEPSGTPAAHAEVVMISHADSSGQAFSDMRVGTGEDGSFAFTSVPVRRLWGIYPNTESLQGRNLAAGFHWCETTMDRQVVNVGKLTLRRGFSVTGQIRLPDKEDIPPGMHVSINSEWTVINRLADIASDGTFEFKALGPGIYNLAVGLNGYAPTPDSPRQILVDHDRPGVIVHMARAP